VSTSASAIKDALVSILGAHTSASAANVSFGDYLVVEQCAGHCAIVVELPHIEQDPLAFGRSEEGTYDFPISIYVKNYGDVATFRTQCITIIDEIATALNDHDDLDNTCQAAILKTVRPQPGMWAVGAQEWKQIDCTIRATVF